MVGELNGSLPKPIQINSGNLRNENDVDPALTNRSIFICRCFPPRCFPTKVIMIPRYKPRGSMLMQKLPEIRSWPLHASTCQVSADCFCLQPEGTLPMHYEAATLVAGDPSVKKVDHFRTPKTHYFNQQPNRSQATRLPVKAGTG